MRNPYQQSKAATKQKSANVLIVDDDAQVVRMIRLVLENHGYSCLSAFGGAQALSQFSQSDDIDVIVTDLSMAWGDGASFIQTVRRHSQIPVFVITGRVREFASKMGAMENVIVLPKPIDTHELVKRIRTACRHRKLRPRPVMNIEWKGVSMMKTRNVLIADDDAGIIRLVQTVLLPMDVRVQDVRDAFSALVAIRQSPPDLAILDINMPAGNGLSVCEMLATDCTLSRVPVIVLTGDPHDDVERRCSMMGAHYVRKGIEAMDQLKALVHEMLAGNQTNTVKSQFFIG